MKADTKRKWKRKRKQNEIKVKSIMEVKANEIEMKAIENESKALNNDEDEIEMKVKSGSKSGTKHDNQNEINKAKQQWKAFYEYDIDIMKKEETLTPRQDTQNELKARKA